MKKTLIAAAAEITFGAWLRTLPTFVASNGDDIVAFATNSWGGSARTARLDINAVAEDGNAGFACGYFDPMNGSIGDSGSARMWVKPIEQVKLTVGSMSPDNNVGGYRRDFCYGSWNWLRPGNWLTDGEGYLIDGVGDWGVHKTGALIEVFPVEGLNAYVMVPFNADGDKVLAEDTYNKVQVGANYAIDGVGTISAVYIGNSTAKKEVAATDDVYGWVAGDTAADAPTWGVVTPAKAAYTEKAVSNSTIEAAFELTSVENLYVGAGFKYNIKDEDAKVDTGSETDPIKIAKKVLDEKSKMAVKLGASYQINEDMKVLANGGVYMFYDNNSVAIDPRFEAGVGLDYNLGDGLSANVDVRYLSAISIDGTEVDNTDQISFLAGVTKGISSNGLVGLGFQGTTNNGGEKNDKLTWSIPVRVEMWF